MANSGESRQYVLDLISKKTAIENEIQAFSEVLKSQGDVGMTKSLVDAEGYPRNDIDIYQVRHARHKIICLQNDHKSILKCIEEGLHKLHANEKLTNRLEETTSEKLEPFAEVQEVQVQSPSEMAGLSVGDLLLKFGSVTHKNFKELQDVANVVQHSVGKLVTVIVRRNDRNIQQFLTPQKWNGLGFLGCKIVPLKDG